MPRNQTPNYVKKKDPPPPAAPIHIPTKSNIANDIASNVVSGFAFGTGSSIARNTIDNLFKQNPEPELKPEYKHETILHKEYLECLKHNHEETCKTFFPNTHK
jgi:hypothetical protein